MIKLLLFLFVSFSVAFLVSCASSSVAEVENLASTSTVSAIEIIAKTDTLCQKHEDLAVLRECLGYGAALRGGIAAARGKIVVMGEPTAVTILERYLVS